MTDKEIITIQNVVNILLKKNINIKDIYYSKNPINENSIIQLDDNVVVNILPFYPAGYISRMNNKGKSDISETVESTKELISLIEYTLIK